MNHPTPLPSIAEDYFRFIEAKGFPCIGAKAALGKDQIRIFLADHMACPKDDRDMLKFLYAFVDDYRQSNDLYSSAVVIFNDPVDLDEDNFETLFWSRLQAISDIDSRQYPYDQRVGHDPTKAEFSFSLKEEAFYLIGLHPGSSRLARRFRYPAIVFNPHAQFDRLRELSKYETMKQVVRNRDIQYSGSVNPMLADFGETSEAVQYTGRQYDQNWKCPFISQHESREHHSTT